MARGYYLEFKNPILRADPYQRLIKIWHFAAPIKAYDEWSMDFTRYGDDGATPQIYQSAANGRRFGEVILTAFRSDRVGENAFVTHTMKQAEVSHMGQPTFDDGRVIETFTLTAKQILSSGHIW